MVHRGPLVLSFLATCALVQFETNAAGSAYGRHVCSSSNENYDCKFRGVFIYSLADVLPFGHDNPQRNKQTDLTFENSALKVLPKALLDGYGNVELLNLERLGIERFEPDALKNGTKLKRLYLGYNHIETLDHKTFRNCEAIALGLFWFTVNLEVISLAGNRLQRIEDDTFRNTPVLSSINVASNNLTHFDLSRIPSLVNVEMQNNQIREVKIHPEIEKLDASHNQIQTVAAASQNVIRGLYLSHNKLNGTAWLRQLTNLQALDLSYNEIEDIGFEDFQELKVLETFNLTNNRLFTFTFTIHNRNELALRSLKALDLSNNNLLNIATNWAQYAQLVELNLDHNFIVSLKNTAPANLQYITLARNDWDCEKLEELLGSIQLSTASDTDTELQCGPGAERRRGICCTSSAMPYHDRLMRYVAEVSVAEKLARATGGCSADAIYGSVANVTNTIGRYGQLSQSESSQLSKELPPLQTVVHDLRQRKSDQQTLLAAIAAQLDKHSIQHQADIINTRHLQKLHDRFELLQRREEEETLMQMAAAQKKALEQEGVKLRVQSLRDANARKHRQLNNIKASLLHVLQ